MARAESTRRVFLIGFMGAGKTTVGQALARRLGWSFRDLDRIIEEREQKSVSAIFAEHSEAGFRRAESAALERLLQETSTNELVVALGGGAFAQAQNRAALERANAVTVLLEAPLDELLRRCEQDETVRPLAQQADMFTALFAERRSAYELARYRVETAGKTIEDVAAEIEQILAASRPEVKQ